MANNYKVDLIDGLISFISLYLLKRIENFY